MSAVNFDLLQQCPTSSGEEQSLVAIGPQGIFGCTTASNGVRDLVKVAACPCLKDANSKYCKAVEYEDVKQALPLQEFRSSKHMYHTSCLNKIRMGEFTVEQRPGCPASSTTGSAAFRLSGDRDNDRNGDRVEVQGNKESLQKHEGCVKKCDANDGEPTLVSGSISNPPDAKVLRAETSVTYALSFSCRLKKMPRFEGPTTCMWIEQQRKKSIPFELLKTSLMPRLLLHQSVGHQILSVPRMLLISRGLRRTAGGSSGGRWGRLDGREAAQPAGGGATCGRRRRDRGMSVAEDMTKMGYGTGRSRQAQPNRGS
ncbi:hypothetical protein B0H19DRAFT_1063506 [Mycena capillaripes]|nr:hypothetical protein B0H19DRAFT_1063506 [Mycena capillaripes]